VFCFCKGFLCDSADQARKLISFLILFLKGELNTVQIGRYSKSYEKWRLWGIPASLGPKVILFITGIRSELQVCQNLPRIFTLRRGLEQPNFWLLYQSSFVTHWGTKTRALFFRNSSPSFKVQSIHSTSHHNITLKKKRCFCSFLPDFVGTAESRKPSQRAFMCTEKYGGLLPRPQTSTVLLSL